MRKSIESVSITSIEISGTSATKEEYNLFIVVRYMNLFEDGIENVEMAAKVDVFNSRQVLLVLFFALIEDIQLSQRLFVTFALLPVDKTNHKKLTVISHTVLWR